MVPEPASVRDVAPAGLFLPIELPEGAVLPGSGETAIRLAGTSTYTTTRDSYWIDGCFHVDISKLAKRVLLGPDEEKVAFVAMFFARRIRDNLQGRITMCSGIPAAVERGTLAVTNIVWHPRGLVVVTTSFLNAEGKVDTNRVKIVVHAIGKESLQSKPLISIQ